MDIEFKIFPHALEVHPFYLGRSQGQIPYGGGTAETGAIVTFEGRVRNHNLGQEVLSLEYEAYEALALKEGERILREACEKFAIGRVLCHHRTGHLQIGELAVWILVASEHRHAAFLASEYIIGEVKKRVPIWKKEHYWDGTSVWVLCQHNHDHHYDHL